MNERDIFIEALQQPDEVKRSTFLDEACGQDTKLRDRVVDLLNQAEGLNSFLDRPAFELTESTCSTAMQEGVGTVIGRYKLMELIGEGGFGLVFVAEQREPVRRRVALKLIKPGMDSSEVIARFEAERQALALMDHPNIARVLDAGTTDAGRPYFVMELIHGTPVNTFCDESQLSTRERLELFLPICRAIQHAHQKGIIHRDIKPSNVLVTLQDGEPLPKVIDFGVAKALDQELIQRTVYTRFQQMIGTPLYMSPEQAEMSDLDVDTRSDIYSLGVLLYELLTGSTPFDRKQLASAAFDELRRIIREEEPPKPSTRLSQSGERLRSLAAQRKTEPAKLSKMMRGDLDWIVMKALEKDRNRRYETANGFADDIQRNLRNEAVVARPPSTGYRLRKFARRNKTVFATISTVMAALLLGAIVSISQAIRANKSEAVMRERLYASEMQQASLALGRGDIFGMKELLHKQIPESPKLNQRGFEYYLLWYAGHLAKKWTFNSNKKAPFHDLAVSPDGRILAATDLAAATIHVFDSENLNLICSPLQIGTPYDRLCFSPNGRYLIAADAQGASLRIFATDTWAHTMTLNSGSNGAVACAREKALMATAKAKEITLWDTTSWTVVGSLPTNDIAHYLAMSPDGTKLASVVRPNKGLDRIDLWDLRQRRVIRTLPGQFVRDDEIVFSPDGNLLAAGDRNGEVRIWSVPALFAKGNEPARPQTLRASNPIGSLAFSPDGTRLAIATSMDYAVSVPDAVQVWDIASSDYRLIATFQDHSKRVGAVSFVRDANTICTIADDLTLKMWDLSESRSYDVIEGVDWRSGIAYANDGRLIYQDYAEGRIRSWDVTKRESQAILDTDIRYSRIGYSADGSFLAGVTHDEQRLWVWNLGNNSKVHTTTLDLEDLKRRIESNGGVSTARGNGVQGRDSDRVIISRLSVSNDGQRVACVVPLQRDAPLPAIVVLINPEDGNPIAKARLPTNAEVPPTFSPSGRRLVTTKWLRTFSMLSEINSDSLHDLFPIPARGPPTCVAYSPDGGTLAIGNYNNEIRLHAATDGALIQVLQDLAQWPTSVAFSRDGGHLVSAAPGGVLIWKRSRLIWNRSSYEYQLVSTLRGLPDLDTMYAAIAPGSDSLAVLHGDARSIEPSHEGKIQVWRIASPEEVSRNVDDQLERTIRSAYTVDQPDETLGQLRDVLAQDPKDLRARMLRGQTYDRIGDWQSAVDDWTKALEQVPDNLHFLESRAKAYELGQEWSAAEDDWNKLVQLTKESNGKYLLERGECYLHMNRRADAHADFAKALTRTASVDSIQRIVSLLGFAESLVPTGSKWRYETGTQRPPDWETTSFDDSQWRTGWAPFGAMQWYLPTRTDTGLHDVWLRRTFELHHDIDAPLVFRLRAEENVEVFIDGVSATPTRIVANYLDDYQWDRQWNTRMHPVVQCSKQVRLRVGTHVLAVHCRNPNGATYVDVGLYAQSDDVDISSMLSEATERAPHNAYLHTALAVRFVEQGKWKDAAMHFHKSAELSDEGSLPKWMWAALMYRHCGDLTRYHELTTEIISREQERYRQLTAATVEPIDKTKHAVRISRLTRACLLADPAGNLPGLIEMADRALELDPQNPSAQVAKALAEFWNGHVETAIEWAEKCREDDRQALCVLALAQARAGKLDLAGNELAKLIEGRGEPLFQVSFRQNHEVHEAMFLEILLNEAKRNLSAP